MIAELCVAVGIILMLYSLILCVRLITKIEDKKIKNTWHFLTFLLGFFLFGYIIFLFSFIISEIHITLTNTLVSLVFAFGSVFVLLSLYTTIRLLDMLNQKNRLLNIQNDNLTYMNRKSKSYIDKLTETKKKLDEKNKELEDTLDDFYTLRLSMEKRMSLNKINKENTDIKRKISKLKKK